MRKLFALFVLSAVVGCEVLEEDISRKEVRIIAPGNEVAVMAGVVDFRWQSLKSAVGYEFVAVSPSFDAAERVAVDTVIYADTLARSLGCRVNLAAGEYEWRVVAFNSGYDTCGEVYRLTVAAPESGEGPKRDAPGNPNNRER